MLSDTIKYSITLKHLAYLSIDTVRPYPAPRHTPGQSGHEHA